MTENEVFEHISNLAGDYKCFDEKISHQESLILCNLIEEIQQHRAIGTIEEFKALKEKSVAKKVEVNEFDYGEGYICGECESFLHYVDDDDEHIRTNYCCHCGTKIDWQ